MELYVKFSPLNENRFSSIINKNVWFSDIFSLNDLWEESIYTSLKHKDTIIPKIKQVVSQIVSERDCDIKATINQSATFSTKGKNNMLSLLEKENLADNHNITALSGLIEIIAYLNTNILSLSSINVFENANAFLMFAHYADSLRGIACVYEYNESKNNIHEVTYEDERKNIQLFCTRNTIENYKTLISGNDHDIFLKKLHEWKYEKEYRFFSTGRGLHTASDYGLTLKGIFHTQKINQSHLDALKEMNKTIYNNELFIKCIHRNYNMKAFPVVANLENNAKRIIPWLEERFNIPKGSLKKSNDS